MYKVLVSDEGVANFEWDISLIQDKIKAARVGDTSSVRELLDAAVVPMAMARMKSGRRADGAASLDAIEVTSDHELCAPLADSLPDLIALLLSSTAPELKKPAHRLPDQYTKDRKLLCYQRAVELKPLDPRDEETFQRELAQILEAGKDEEKSKMEHILQEWGEDYYQAKAERWSDAKLEIAAESRMESPEEFDRRIKAREQDARILAASLFNAGIPEGKKGTTSRAIGDVWLEHQKTLINK